MEIVFRCVNCGRKITEEDFVEEGLKDECVECGSEEIEAKVE